MKTGNAARVVVVLGAAFALLGSASSNSNQPAQQPTMTDQTGQRGESPPPPQQMEPARALGVWRSTFGAVKIEADNSRGGLQTGSVQGVWVYQRQGEEVIGYFSGNLRGNVLEFTWQEPANPPLTGAGYLVFDRSGRQYSGRWWSDARDRVGDWNGWRNQVGGPPPPAPAANPYDTGATGGQTYAPPAPGPAPAPARTGPAEAAPEDPTLGPQPPPKYY